MSSYSLVVAPADWRDLQRHLLKNDVEQAAMIFTSADVGAGGVQFRAREIELLAEADFDHQSAYHISLTDEARGRVIKRAWDLKLSMVEVHSHVGSFASAAFSPSDWSGFGEFVPHVRWRLRGAPYAAVVVTRNGFDGLAWADGDEPAPLDHLLVGEERLVPTQLSLPRRWTA
jgi:hypothetical protein